MTAGSAIGSFDEAGARRVLLVQAFETGAAGEQWTTEDRAWATRLTRESSAGAPPSRFLDDRARHALQRLAQRDGGVRQALQAQGWRMRWVVLACAVGLVCGLAADSIGSSQRINLLAPPVWAVVAWNLVVYVLLLIPFPKPLRLWFGASLTGLASSGDAGASEMGRFRTAWLKHAAPLLTARAALLMHVAAAALALGLIGSLYVRGVVLDYRAGWQSTFLNAGQVHAALATLLAPAVGLTGLSLPDTTALESLRVGASDVPAATAANSAAAWIHLYAATLVLFVVLPRSVLALSAWVRAGFVQRRLLLPLEDPYFQRLLREHSSQAAHVQVLPYDLAPSPHALACLKSVLTSALGSALKMTASAATAYGDEDAAASLQPASDTSLRIALVDLSATPEDDSHGAFVRALRRAAPAVAFLVLADETAFRARFATLPTRLAERREAWRLWARSEGIGLVCVDLAQPDLATAERDLQAALQA